MATDNMALVRRFIEEVWNKGNVAVLGDFVSEKYLADVPIIGELRGHEALKLHVISFRTAFPDLRITIEEIGLANDRVYTRWTARGTHRGTFMGLAPTNKSGTVRGISLDELTSGKVVEHHESYDSLALLQIVGAVAPLERLLKATGTPQQQSWSRA
jgi:steroid delta-isomerase-like uncharacterized protein